MQRKGTVLVLAATIALTGLVCWVRSSATMRVLSAVASCQSQTCVAVSGHSKAVLLFFERPGALVA